jgi:hypothetical protein
LAVCTGVAVWVSAAGAGCLRLHALTMAAAISIPHNNLPRLFLSSAIASHTSAGLDRTIEANRGG